MPHLINYPTYQLRKLTHNEPTMVHKMLSGAFAGVFAQSMTYPLEVSVHSNAVSIIYLIIALQMIRRNMQTHGFVDKQRIDSAFVEHTTQLPKPGPGLTSPHTITPGGGIATSQLGSGMNQKFIEQHFDGFARKTKSPTFLSTASVIYSTSGMRGFFKGLLLNWIKGPITLSISFTTYDIIKVYLDNVSLWAT